ncbi:MAG: fibronectin type III domain-containing protein, partial [Thermoplasmata archaeon]|nr:fibronectin type III domain-containing protein [Thermoplasmata archaeon]
TGGAVDLYWAAATDPDLIECNSDPSIPITYHIYLSTTSGGQDFLTPDAATQDTSLQITGLQNGVTYYFIVRAQDAVGNEEGNTIEESAMPTTPMDTTPPQFQGLLSATDLGTYGNVSLTWSDATDPDTIECNSDPSLPIEYNVYVSTTSGGQDFLTPDETATGTQATITGLQNGVTYYFVVRAMDSAGNEEDNTIERTAMPTTPVDSTPPIFDGLNLIVTDNGTGDMTLIWNAATDPDDPECNADPSTPITYNIYVSEVPGVFDFNLPSATTSQQQYPFLDLERGVIYYFIVRAEDNAGNEETNTVTKTGELEVQEEEFNFLDYWWIFLVVIIILLVAIILLLARRARQEEPIKTPEQEEIKEESTEEMQNEE